jgi:hypothetical protein
MNYYTYTILFVDGYYYHGYHKYEGVDPLVDGYYGSPVTHKEKWLTTMYWKVITGTYESHAEVQFAEQEFIRPVFSVDPYCLNANCNGIPAPELARKGARKAGKKAGQRVKELKINVCDPVNQEKGRQTARERGSGFHSYEFQHTFEMIEMRKENGRRSGAQAVATGQIAQARACIDKNNQRRAGTENLKKAHAKARKPLEVYTPQGVLLTFDSLTEACRSLKIDMKTLSRVARGKSTSYKGYVARYF